MDSTFQSLEKITPETLLSFNNPVFFSLFIIIVILAVTIIYYRFVVVPLKIKFVEEKQALQIQQSEMMAMFSELSPDPVIRCDVSGKILMLKVKDVMHTKDKIPIVNTNTPMKDILVEMTTKRMGGVLVLEDYILKGVMEYLLTMS